MKHKKVIRSSNLCLRFYLSDLWSEALLNSLCAKGGVHCAHPFDADPYYTLKPQSRFDCEKLLEHASYVDRMFDDDPTLTDLEFLKKMNGL